MYKLFAIDIGEFLAALWNSVISNHDEDNNNSKKYLKLKGKKTANRKSSWHIRNMKRTQNKILLEIKYFKLI